MAALIYVSSSGVNLALSGSVTFADGVLKGRVSGPDFTLEFIEEPPRVEGGTAAQARVVVELALAPVGLRVDAVATLALPLEADQLTIKLIEGRALLEKKELFNLLIDPNDVQFSQLGADPWLIKIVPLNQAPENSPYPLPVATLSMFGAQLQVGDLELNASGVVSAVVWVSEGATVSVGQFVSGRVVSGSAQLSGRHVTLNLTLALEFDYFKGSRVELQVYASRGSEDSPWLVASTTRVNTGMAWTDPSGSLSFDQMGIEIDVAAGADGKLGINDVRSSGTVTFRADGLEAKSREWLGDLFSGLSSEFRNVSLSGKGLAGNLGFSFNFKPHGGLSVKALGVFALTIPEFSFGMHTLTLKSPSLALNLGATSLRGALEEIVIDLAGAPSVNVDALSISMAMSSPGGVKASASLKHVHTETEDTMEGEGQLTTPTFPGVQVTFRVGRFLHAGNWYGTLVIYAAQPVDIPLFPGVQVNRLGLGLGVNAEVAGTTHLTLAQARQRLSEGLPDVSRPGSWKAARTDLTLLARIFVSPMRQAAPDQASLYVADMTLIVTSDFQIAVLGKMWLMTSLADAQTEPFQQRPTASMMMLMDGQEPSLRAVAQTRSDGRSSSGASGTVALLIGMVPETRLAFEATPTGLAVVVGPNPVSGDLGPLKISGSSMLAFRSTPTATYAITRSTLEARFAASAGLSFGLVRISASLRFGFASELVLLGQFKDKVLIIYGHAHVAAYIEVNLHLTIEFRIRIGLPFGRSITISWHNDWDFNWRVAVDLDIELALTSTGDMGLLGRAWIQVDVVGIQVSLEVPVAANTKWIDDGRNLHAQIGNDLRLLTGLTP